MTTDDLMTGGDYPTDLLGGDDLAGEQEAPEAGRPDAATIRAQLRERGHDPPARARLSQDWIALWESGETATGPGDGEGGAAEQVTAAAPPAAGGRARKPAGERQPRRPKASRSLRERVWGKTGDSDSGGKEGNGSGRGRGGRTTKTTSKPRHERVSIERVVTEIGEALSRAVRDFDPAVSRCLHYEAGLAGMTAEDMLRGTLVDKALQPLARGEERFRKGGALVAFPVLVGMVERATELPPQQRAVRLAVLAPMLREVAAQVIGMSGDLIERQQQREQEQGSVMEQADALIQVILFGAEATPAGPAAADGAGGEHDQAAAAQQAATPGGFMFTAPPPPPQSPYAHPYAEPRPPRVIPGQVL